MENKILLVDGSNLLFQMFFGMPSQITGKDGTGIWGVLGFIGALLKIIRRISPTHTAVFFDGQHENRRLEMNAEYKANRPDYSQVPDEENPFSQLPYIYQALKYLGIAFAETTDCETDDWISGFVSRYGNENKIIISSFDSDFFQLISENVSILRYRGKNSCLCDSGYLLEKYGISPCQYADFKSLTGDAADNIKGADKIGPKTASALLSEFGTLDNIIKNADKIKKPSVRASIKENSGRLILNYRLIKLNDKAALPFGLDEIRYVYEGATAMEVLQGIGLV